MSERILDVKNLKVYFPVKHKRGRFVRAVDDVSFTLDRGEILSLVGESGSGKTTAGKAILRIIEPTGGSVKFMGEELGAERVDEFKGKDIWHRLARLIGGISALIGAVLSLALPMAEARKTGLAAGCFSLVFSPSANRELYGLGADVAVFAALIPLMALLAALLCLLMTKRPRLAAGFDGLGILGALLICLSLRGSLSVGPGVIGAMAALSLSALVILILPGFYSPAFEKELRRRAQMIFQDPYQSLNPRQCVLDIVAEPLDVNGMVKSQEEREAGVQSALERAGLQPAGDYFFRYPYELSGGQRQRVAVAAALASKPDFIVADEPVSMIDASIRLGIVKLMKTMQAEENIAFLFITHDLSLAWLISDRIAIMYLGKIVEIGTADQIIKNCRHPYARALMDAMPLPGVARSGERMLLKGDIPSAAVEISGCRFHGRCPFAAEKCRTQAPELIEVEEGHLAACHRLDEI